MKQITHVAIIISGKLYSLPKPLRHGDIYKAKSLLEGSKQRTKATPPDIQGFLDEDGVFLNRRDALKRVLEIGQTIVNLSAIRGDKLYSEDVWETEGRWDGQPGTPEYNLYWNTHCDEALVKQLKIVNYGVVQCGS